MGWSYCGTDDDGREIGYGIPATCDDPGCEAEINRGLSYVCGSMHGGGAFGCGRYFCGEHVGHIRGPDDDLEQLCSECATLYDVGHPDEEDDE